MPLTCKFQYADLISFVPVNKSGFTGSVKENKSYFSGELDQFVKFIDVQKFWIFSKESLLKTHSENEQIRIVFCLFSAKLFD